MGRDKEQRRQGVAQLSKRLDKRALQFGQKKCCKSNSPPSRHIRTQSLCVCKCTLFIFCIMMVMLSESLQHTVEKTKCLWCWDCEWRKYFGHNMSVKYLVSLCIYPSNAGLQKKKGSSIFTSIDHLMCVWGCYSHCNQKVPNTHQRDKICYASL